MLFKGELFFVALADIEYTVNVIFCKSFQLLMASDSRIVKSSTIWLFI